MPKITIVNEKKEIEVPQGANLRQALREAAVKVYQGIELYLNCQGFGLCGTCRVLVKKGMENLSAKGFIEKTSLSMHWIANNGQEEEARLSCQCAVNGDVSIEVRPEANLCGENFWTKTYPNK